MAKKLRTKDKVLLVLSGLIDIFEEIRNPLGLPSSAFRNLYGFDPAHFKKQRLYNAVWRSLKTGDIEKVIKNGKSYLRLTSQGKKKIIRDFPLLSLQNKKWDRKWRLVFFDIEETSRYTRDILRTKLKQLGFAQIQRSVYITPHNLAEDLREFLEHLGLEKYVYVATIEKLLAGKERTLAQKLWNLEKINKEYKKILEDWERESKDQTKLREKILRRYLEISTVDPFLPQELLPPDWKRKELEKLIKSLS